MNITIDPASQTPPFEQLRLRVLDLIRQGELIAGTKIPTVRALAGELGLAPNTVARAYRELEREGVIETRGRHGSFIKATGDRTRQLAQEAATRCVAQIRKLGFDDDE